MPSLVEVREELAAKRQELHEIFDEAGPDMDLAKVKRIDGDTAAKAGDIKRRNEELTALGIEFDRLSLLQEIGRNNAAQHQKLNDPTGTMVHLGGNGANGASSKAGSPRQQMKTFLRDH